MHVYRLQSTPPPHLLEMYLSQSFFKFCNDLWNARFGKACSGSSVFFLISYIVSKWRPFKVAFSFGGKNKFAGATSEK